MRKFLPKKRCFLKKQHNGYLLSVIYFKHEVNSNKTCSVYYIYGYEASIKQVLSQIIANIHGWINFELIEILKFFVITGFFNISTPKSSIFWRVQVINCILIFIMKYGTM